MEKKITKMDLFARLLELTEVQADEDLRGFVSHEMELLVKKAEKAKGYKRKKSEDTLKTDVYAALASDEFRIISDIVADLEDQYADLTPAKVTARLTALVKDGLVVKEDVKIDKRVIKGYKLA